jgi:hypothetical protein
MQFAAPASESSYIAGRAPHGARRGIDADADREGEGTEPYLVTDSLWTWRTWMAMPEAVESFL